MAHVSIVAALRLEVRKVKSWVRVGLLLALPYAKEIKSSLEASLPSLQPYLPANIYQFMGGAVVAVGAVLSLVNALRSVKDSQ